MRYYVIIHGSVALALFGATSHAIEMIGQLTHRMHTEQRIDSHRQPIHHHLSINDCPVCLHCLC